jgi:hypothetical protein
VALYAFAGSAKALPVTLDFTGMETAYYGKANVLTTTFGGVVPACGGFFNCYSEDGFIVGTVDTPTSPFAHLHKGVLDGDAMQYHADSGGIYIRSADFSAFSLDSLLLKAPIGPGNTYTGDIVIKGFNEALTSSTQSQVAFQSVKNGFDGELFLGSDFRNISAFWIHYDQYPQVPPVGVTFDLKVDAIKLSQVPVPGAVWFLGTGLMGLVSLRRKKLKSA